MALTDDCVFRDAVDRGREQIGVEVFSFRYDKQDMEKLRSLLVSFEGHPLTLHGPMRSAELTEKKGSSGLRRSFDAYRRALSLAQEGDARHMVVHTHECFVRPEEKHERMKRCEENIRELALIAQAYGVQLTIENVSLPSKGFPLYNEDEYISLIKRLPECAALIDIGHVHCTGWHMEKLCCALSGRISGFHMHNNDGCEDLHAWLEDGTMDIASALKIMGKYCKNSDLILEYGDTKGKTSDDLLRDAKLVRLD